METHPLDEPLMTCRYCILFEMGHCRKTNPFPKEKEPRFLRLQNGTLLQLTFDCANCQMLITSVSNAQAADGMETAPA